MLLPPSVSSSVMPTGASMSFTSNDGTPSVFLRACVDDLLIATKTTDYAMTILNALSEHWTLSDLGPVTHILGIQVDRNDNSFCLSQTAYIDTLLAQYVGQLPTSGQWALLPNVELLMPANNADDVFDKQRQYQELVGSLLWLSGCTHPDISFTASFLSRACHALTQQHWDLGMLVINYLRHTHSHCMTLAGHNDSALQVYVDADYAGDIDTCHSTTGYVAFFNGSPITWASKCQQTVTSSTMEAEYIATTEATKETIWLRHLLLKLGLNQVALTTLFVNNESAITFANNPSMHARSQHIDVHHHLIREQANELHTIRLIHISTEDQKANMLTKPLPGPVHSCPICAFHLSSTTP